MDLDQAKDYLIELLPKAGETVLKYFNSKDTLKLTQKTSEVDFATQADFEIDKFLLESLTERFPGTNFLTEETAPESLNEFREKDNLWIIDPIDGTTNFSRGSTNFAISVGLVNKAKPVLGVIYLPFSQKIYWAKEDNDHAYCNGEIVKVSIIDKLNHVVLATDWANEAQKRLKTAEMLTKVVDKVRQVKSMGSAVADIASLADGTIDVYMNYGLKPWDVAAVSLIAQKAGAKISKLDGSEWNVFDDEILITNGQLLHEKFVELLN